MIYESEQPGRGVFATDCPFPEALAVIQGNNPGWVFVDDMHTPRAALVCAQGMQGFYLIGDTKGAGFIQALDEHIERVLGPRLRNLGVAWFEVSGGKGWNAVIEGIFAGRGLESSQQWVYTLRPGRESLLQCEAAGDCELSRVDQLLPGGLSASDEEFLLSRLLQFWGGVSAFLKRGLGYALVCGGEIVSVCCSGFVAGDVHAIDIETKASQRGKGYAEAVARAFIAECVERRLQPHWDCMAENVASARLAEKLGLAQSHTYTLYSFPLTC